MCLLMLSAAMPPCGAAGYMEGMLVVMKSAICCRASKLVGVFPFLSWSWIIVSSSSQNACKDANVHLREWLYVVRYQREKVHEPDSEGSWRLSSSAPSCWSLAAGRAPCFSPSGTPDCSHPPGRSTAPCAGLWWEGEPSPPRDLTLRSSWADLLQYNQPLLIHMEKKQKPAAPSHRKWHQCEDLANFHRSEGI